MLAHQFEHPEVFALLMQRTALWLRLINAAEVGDEAFETEHSGNPLACALHGSQHRWHRDKGDYPAVKRALLAAGAQIPRPEKPLEATEEVLEIIRQHGT